MFLSIFDLFKIGIGPSSSHTMGPMTAANLFLKEIKFGDWPRPANAYITHIKVYLHGSLAFTGIGHATDRAIILGLCGQTPDKVDPDKMDEIALRVKETKTVCSADDSCFQFDPQTDLIFDRKNRLPGHSNGMVFEGLDVNGQVLLRRVYYSIGGGFVSTEDELNNAHLRDKGPAVNNVPYPFKTALEMLKMAGESNLTIAEMKRANEEVHMSHAELNGGMDKISQTMLACIQRGIEQTGELAGGLHIKRRAKGLYESLQKDEKSNRHNPLLANDWLSVYAIAVNEENAAGGRVVTAPTNGASGVVPSVLQYYLKFYEEVKQQDVYDFLLTAAAIGGIIKHNASISGAEVGCQGEVGSASAMAAAGFASVMGGTPAQVENAAEIALEHHLGMTCDPVKGLVQVPCIERNALGAVKAVTGASLALYGDGTHFVPLDVCIETMRQTGHDMHSRYKETSEGGLAVNMVEC